MSRTFAVIALALAACSSDSSTTDSPAAACGDVTGTWTVTYARDQETPGTCVAGNDPAPTVLTISTDGVGSGKIALQGVKGSCPARIDGCKLTAACIVTYRADGGNGVEVATETDQYSLAFGTDNFTGFVGGALVPTDAGIKQGVKQCSANFNATGKRK